MKEISSGLTSLAFDHILVVDRIPLTGIAMMLLAKSIYPRAECEHVASFSSLFESVTRCVDKKLLVIMELVTDKDSLSRGLLIPGLLEREKSEPICRVMICTDLADPLLLHAVCVSQPAAIALRNESLTTLIMCMLRAGFDKVNTEPFQSCGVRSVMSKINPVALSPRELQWLIIRISGGGQADAALAMGVKYKTVASFSHSVAGRLGFRHRLEFARWLAKLRLI